MQVRELVEFVLRTGDLGGERDFVTRDRALAGSRGHQKIQRARAAGYQKEFRISQDVCDDELVLRIQGRIDGLLQTDESTWLEEIKTVQTGWDGVPDPLHWGQLKCYGALYAQQHDLERITLQLTYLNLDTNDVTELQETFTRPDLNQFFQELTSVYLEWIRDQHRWNQKRDVSIRALSFPFSGYRAGQRELAVAAYRAIVSGKRLFAEAPTGIGKTLATLFPSIKALAEGKVERIFYVTARTTGQPVAEKALSDLRAAGLAFRSLVLTAKEKVCVQEGKACELATCPFAQGYYDRRKPAMRDALQGEELNRSTLDRIARAHRVCPFELALDLSLCVDAVVCDYNYVFDPHVYLRRHFDEDASNCVLLVDEAHNLVDRARDMFSAGLGRAAIRQTTRALADQAPACAKALRKLDAALRKLCQADPALESDVIAPQGDSDLFSVATNGSSGSDAGQRVSRAHLPLDVDDARRCLPDLPEHLMPILERAVDEAEAWLAQNQAAEFRGDLLELYFQLRSFSRTAAQFDAHYVVIVTPGPDGGVQLFCLDPSELLRSALSRARAALLFSATLTPLEYHRELLGGSGDDPILRLSSPFAQENFSLLVHDGVRTQFRSRDASLGAVVDSIAAVIQAKAGNYLAYLPSYKYLESVRAEFQRQFPDVSILAQAPGMPDSEREAFLAEFASDPAQTRLGFAVLGGVFGEAIDLVGDRLIGAIVVGVGLPQLCLERDLVRRYFDEKESTGFEYAYTFPGMNRVLQATGRVIRSETDRGVVLLLDTRFGEERYRRLFPHWWRPKRLRSPQQIQTALKAFWRSED